MAFIAGQSEIEQVPLSAVRDRHTFTGLEIHFASRTSFGADYQTALTALLPPGAADLLHRVRCAWRSHCDETFYKGGDRLMDDGILRASTAALERLSFLLLFYFPPFAEYSWLPRVC